MKNKGFTLIELLSVIVVIAIVTLIAFPVISGVVEKTKLKALEDSAYGLVEASNLYYAQYANENTVRFDKNEDENTLKNLSYKGSIEKGTVIINSKGQVTVCISDGKNSAYKNYNENKVTAVAKKTCTIPSNTYIVYLDDERTVKTYTTEELTEIVEELSDKISTMEEEITALKEENTNLKSELNTKYTNLSTQLSNNVSTLNATIATKTKGKLLWSGTATVGATLTLTDSIANYDIIYVTTGQNVLIGDIKGTAVGSTIGLSSMSGDVNLSANNQHISIYYVALQRVSNTQLKVLNNGFAYNIADVSQFIGGTAENSPALDLNTSIHFYNPRQVYRIYGVKFN